jgi:hypothetical protein
MSGRPRGAASGGAISSAGPDALIAAASPEAKEQGEAKLRARASVLVAELVKSEQA